MTGPAANLVLFSGFWFPSKTLYVLVVPSLWVNGDTMRARLWSQLDFTRFFLVQGWSKHQGILLQQLPTRVVSHLSINRPCHRNVAQCIRIPGRLAHTALQVCPLQFTLSRSRFSIWLINSRLHFLLQNIISTRFPPVHRAISITLSQVSTSSKQLWQTPIFCGTSMTRHFFVPNS